MSVPDEHRDATSASDRTAGRPVQRLSRFAVRRAGPAALIAVLTAFLADAVGDSWWRPLVVGLGIGAAVYVLRGG